MKQIITLCLCFYAFSYVLKAQNNATPGLDNFSITSSGLKYKIIKDSVGTTYPEAGGYITFWFDMRTIKDSIFDDQFSDLKPVGIPTRSVTYKASIEEGFLLLTEGDSAVFLLSADSLYKNTFEKELPEFLQKGSMIYMTVKMHRVYSKHFVDSVMTEQKQMLALKEIAEKEAYLKDSISIQDYLAKHKLKGEAIDGGVYIVKLKSAKKKEPYIIRAEIVETKYIGKLLTDGTVFDQTTGETYFEFTVGIGEVIQGWDYAFQRLKLGEKALILIPSGMAYGVRGAGDAIPPNTPLLFEVDIKK